MESVLTTAASGAGGTTTVNVAGMLVPPAVVTVMPAGPSGAVAATTRVAVIRVPVTTTPVAVIPAGRFRVAPIRLVPVKITGSPIPITPEAGATLASVGAGGLTVNVPALVVPPGVVMVMLCGPTGAMAAMLKV